MKTPLCDEEFCSEVAGFQIIDEEGEVVGYGCEPHAVAKVENSGGELYLRDL